MSKLFIISGPSGVGKGTLRKEVFKQLNNPKFICSYTSRQPRDYEKEGLHYHFISSDSFKNLIKQDKFLEWAQVHHKHYYGTPKKEVYKALKKFDSVWLEIDVQGARQIKAQHPEAVSIFIKPESKKQLSQQIADRQTMDPEQLKHRLKTSDTEMTEANNYEYVVTNTPNNLPQAIQIILAIVKRELED